MALKTNKVVLREDSGWTPVSPAYPTVHIVLVGSGYVEYAVAGAAGDLVEGEYPILNNKAGEKVFLNLGANIVFARNKIEVGDTYLLVTAY